MFQVAANFCYSNVDGSRTRFIQKWLNPCRMGINTGFARLYTWKMENA